MYEAPPDGYEWRIFGCSDCKEEHGFPYVIAHLVPADTNPEAGGDFDFCPRCGSYLSFVPWGAVTVTRVPWASRSGAR